MSARGFAKVSVRGQPVCWLGANFWSRSGGPLMWRNYDPALVRDELRVLRDHGLTMTRSFFYWPDFHPSPDCVDEECVSRYRDFLDAHTELGMGTIPTFIVGHMSGENWDPPWRDGRDLYADVWMVGRQAWFVEELTRRYTGHPAVVGWLISNEMPIYGEPSDRATVTAWAQLMVQAVRAGGGTEPVSIGDGAWGVEVSGEDNGFSVRDLARLTDFVGPHVYKMEDDVARQHYAAAFVCELSHFDGKPVVLEEFGLSSQFAADDHAADYYRQVLHNSLLAGATGWIGWNNTDFDLVDQPPYSHHPFELHFGLTRADGTPKPQLREMARFANVLRDIDVVRCSRPPADTALVVPSYLECDYPFVPPEDRRSIVDTTRQAYVAAKAADLAVGIAREVDGLPEDCRLYLVPSVKQLTGPTWRVLEQRAAAGATVYVSYSHGPGGWQRGPWHSHLNEMFGVEHRLRYGLVDPIDSPVVSFRFVSAWGDVRVGDALKFVVGGTAHSRSYLPVRPVDAEVLAVDGHDRPALLRRRVGDGAIVLCTYGLEHMASVTPRVNPEQTYRLYAALAQEAGVDRPVTVPDPAVSASVLVHEDGRRFAFLVSQSELPLSVRPVTSGQLSSLRGEPMDTVELSPYDVRVLTLT